MASTAHSLGCPLAPLRDRPTAVRVRASKEPRAVQLARPCWSYTHAIDINAPCEDVWPWIAQIGQRRGGFYSFERLENLIGCKITNTDRILAEHQALFAGDSIRLHPKAPPLHVTHVDPPHALVLRGTPLERKPEIDDPPATDSIWAFHLVPLSPNRCRLIERGITTHGDTLTDRPHC